MRLQSPFTAALHPNFHCAARELLLQTDMSIMHITMACGFQSACHFSKSYRDAFGVAPTRERRKQVAPLAQGPGGASIPTLAMMHA